IVTVVERFPRDADGTVLEDEPAVRSLRVMRWGLVPFWAKDPSVGNRMINTRAETASEKPSFRNALARRRCLIPADGGSERKTVERGVGRRVAKEPYFITTQDGSSLGRAGVCGSWRDRRAGPEAPPLITCSVSTTQAVGRLADIHERMSPALPRQRWSDWLGPSRT